MNLHFDPFFQVRVSQQYALDNHLDAEAQAASPMYVLTLLPYLTAAQLSSADVAISMVMMLAGAGFTDYDSDSIRNVDFQFEVLELIRAKEEVFLRPFPVILREPIHVPPAIESGGVMLDPRLNNLLGIGRKRVGDLMVFDSSQFLRYAQESDVFSTMGARQRMPFTVPYVPIALTKMSHIDELVEARESGVLTPSLTMVDIGTHFLGAIATLCQDARPVVLHQ